MNRVVSIFFLFAVCSIAVAQEGTEKEGSPSAAASPAEMRTYAEDAVTSVSENAKAVRKLVSDSQSDAEAMSCLVPKNTAIAALEGVTKSSQKALSSALDAAKTDVAGYHHRLIKVSVSRAESIRAAAEACGKRSSTSGQNKVVKWSGGTGEDDDTNDRGENPLDIGFDPPNVSPFAL